MKLNLSDLCTIHRVLLGHPIDYAKSGGLALQRSGHQSPAKIEISADGENDTAEISWLSQTLGLLEGTDANRITEDGAEAVAITYVNSKSGWVVKRRLQRNEHADWLMGNGGKWLALEVSGTVGDDLNVRLRKKRRQVALCTLPVERLAVVVQFDEPLIMAGSV
jgi:hypothetical protein